MKRKKTKFLPVVLAMLLMVSNISASMTALAAVKGEEGTSVIEVTEIGEDVSDTVEDEETEGTGTEAGTEGQAEAETETEDGKDDRSAEEEPEQDESEEDADDEETGSDPDEGESETEEDEPESEEEPTEADEDETESVEADDIEDAETDEDEIEEAEEEALEEDEGAVSGAASAGTVATLGIMLLDDEDVSVESCGNAVRYSLEDGVLTITGEGDMWDWDSASEVPWSASMDEITSVVIKDGVTSIGNYAFYDADVLESVEFADTVISIGKYAFYHCDALTTVSSMKNIEEMGEYAFYDCEHLSGEVDLSSLDVIPDHAFHYGKAITGVTFSETLTYIGASAFDNCRFEGENIELVFPDTLEFIGDEAFYWGRGIKKVEFPDSLQYIGELAFYYCPLNDNESKTTTVASGATVITRYGTEDTESTEEETEYTGITVEIPDSVTYIGKEAFNWSNVGYFVVGSRVDSFDGSAFASYDLEGVIVDNTQDNVDITDRESLWTHTSNDVAIIFTNNTAIEEPNDIVCMIGETGYSSIATALEAAGDEETTITLVSNVEESIVIGSGQNIILDLNGYTLSGDGKESAEAQTNSYKAVIVNEGTLTITGNGTVDAVTHQTAAVSNDIGATCTIESGTFKRSNEKGNGTKDNGGNSYYTICNQGTMIIEDGTFENNGSFSSLIINGFYNGINESEGNEAELTINGGTFEGGLNCLKNDEFGVTVINDGEFSNPNQAVLMNYGEMTITDGTFTGTGDDVILACATGEDGGEGLLTIEGGTFTANTTYELAYINMDGVTVVISGGEFVTSTETMFLIYDQVTEYEVSISGGTFADKDGKKFDVSEYLVYGYTQDDQGTVISYAVCSVGENKYISIADALAAIEESDDKAGTIILLTDVSESIVIKADLDVTLDHNGFTLSGDGEEKVEENTNSYKAVIVNEGTLTITGEGTVDAVTHQTAAVSNDIGATCTIESGTFMRSNEAGSSSGNGGNSYYTICNQGTMTIAGGTFKNDGSYSSMILNGFYHGISEDPEETPAVLVIEGGSFSGGLNCVKNDEYGDLTIKGGTFTNNNQAVLMNWNDAVINDGTFTSEGDDLILACSDGNSSSTLTINDGEFSYSGEWEMIFFYEGDVFVEIMGGTFNNAFAGDDTYMFWFEDYDANQEVLAISGGTFRDSKAQAKSDVSDWVIEGYMQNDYGTVLPAQKAVIEVFDVDGTVLAGVTVQILDEGGNVVEEGTTDESGTVTFALALGIYTVRITDSEGRVFESLEQTFELAEAGTTVEVEFDAEPVEFAVEVEVNGVRVESDSNGQYNYEKTYDGESVTLTVTAESSSDATYVWYETGSNATKSDPVSTNDKLVLDSPDAGEYSYVCIVTESYENGAVIGTVSVIVNVTINKASQDISYAETTVSKSVGDEPFTNELAGAVGNVTYTSSDESVATVDANGRVTIVGAGTTTITASAGETTNYESASASYTLTVTGEETVKKADQDIRFAETEITYTIGDEPFTNELIDAVGEVTYTSSNESVATVDADGRVTIIGAGTTVITATASGDENYNEGSATYTLTVKDADKENPEPEPEPEPGPGPAEGYSLTVAIVDKNGSYATGVAYEIYDPEGNLVASGSQGSAVFVVDGLEEGTYTVTITNKNGYVFSSSEYSIEVGADSESITIQATNAKTYSSGGSSGGSGGSSSSGRRSSSSIAEEKSGKWILEGALFTYPDGSHPSNQYLNIDGEIWAFYTNGYAVNRNHESYYTAEAIAAAGNIPTATGTWEVCGWWYQYDDGTYPHNEWAQLTYDGQTYWYHFDVDGWMDDGWFNEDGNTYYLDPVYDGYRGHMVTGWQFIDGYWYYFESNGALLKSGTTPDGYTVDADGRWIE